MADPVAMRGVRAVRTAKRRILGAVVSIVYEWGEKTTKRTREEWRVVRGLSTTTVETEAEKVSEKEHLSKELT